MKTGWTGGQYSIYRVLLAFALGALLGTRLLETTTSGFASGILIAGLFGCVALGLGWHDRKAAWGLLVILGSTVALIDGAPLVLPRADVVVGILLLGLHLATPSDPFGAYSSLGRIDPGGDWAMPTWLPHFVWGLLAVVYLAMDLERLAGIAFSPAAIDAGGMAWFGVVLDLLFLTAVVRRRLRPSAWIAMTFWKLAWYFAFGSSTAHTNLWLLHLLAFDPAWIPGRSQVSPDIETSSPARLFYDGTCGLCHRTVRIILAEDTASDEAIRLRFAPLDGETCKDMLARNPSMDPSDLPDSIFVELEDGRTLDRAAAAMEIANRLGGYWRVIAFTVSLGGLVPTAALDVLYDVVAKNRKRFFDDPKDSCPILPPHLRARFDS